MKPEQLFSRSHPALRWGRPTLLGTCAWSCSSSLVENSVRQCGGTSISATIPPIWFLMLSHSSAVKKFCRTRNPSSWNWKRWGGDCFPGSSGGRSTEQKKTALTLHCASDQREKHPNFSPAAGQRALNF